MPFRPKIPCTQCKRLGPCGCARRLKAQRNAEAPIARAVVAAATRCSRCGCAPTPDNPLTMGHTPTPVSQGGRATSDNRRAECRRCNSSKGGRL